MTRQERISMDERRERVLSSIMQDPQEKPGDGSPVYEKIKWLNAHDLTMQKVMCANKIYAKEYAKLVAGDEIGVAKTIQVFDTLDELDLKQCPDSFFIKRSSGCAKNILVSKNNVDYKKIAKTIESWDNDTICGLGSKEYQYSLSIPRCFAEENLLRNGETSLIDYRHWCFNGKCAFIAINSGRGHGSQVFYSTKFEKMDMFNTTHMATNDIEFKKPENFEKTVRIAEKLSSAFKFVRVDLYNIDGKAVLGEFTFSPGGYCTRFVDSSGRSMDSEIGKMLAL